MKIIKIIRWVLAIFSALVATIAFREILSEWVITFLSGIGWLMLCYFFIPVKKDNF